MVLLGSIATTDENQTASKAASDERPQVVGFNRGQAHDGVAVVLPALMGAVMQWCFNLVFLTWSEIASCSVTEPHRDPTPYPRSDSGAGTAHSSNSNNRSGSRSSSKRSNKSVNGSIHKYLWYPE